MADLIAIVPAKASSTRVPNKNYREFWNGRSLVDLVLGKLQKIPQIKQVYLSCEDESKFTVAADWGIRFVPRSPALCANDVPMTSYIPGVVRECIGDADCDVLWAQVCDPMFDDYAGLVETWEEYQHAWPTFDSACVVYPRKGYLLDERHQPLGFGFGPWHVKSQSLPTHYELNFTASILTRESLRRTGYFVGAEPLWYEVEGKCVDIDTQADFELARKLYALTHEEPKKGFRAA